MKILFIGTVYFSFKALEKLISLNADIVGVCTKKKSSFNSDFSDITPLCTDNNIPFKYIDDINSNESIQWIQSFNSDIIFCLGWSSLIKYELLKLSPMGIIGYHSTKLPLNRGRHPLIWSLALGVEESASTFFFMDEGADSGDILSQHNFIIDYTDDASSLYDKIINISLKQIEEFLPKLQKNRYKKIPQNHKIATYWRKRGRNDGKIDFRMKTRDIYNLVRALTKPYIGAHIEYKDKDIKVWKVEETNLRVQNNIEFGKIIKLEEKSIFIKCSDGIIKIIEHEFKDLPNEGDYL